MNKLILVYLVIISFTQFDNAADDYSKMSTEELNQAFIIAVQKGSSDEVQNLIRAGANVNTPITYAWTTGDYDCNIESTALIYAARHNRPHIADVLLNADKNKLSEALDIAIKEGYSGLVEALIKGGVDINHVNDNEQTPLIIAVQHACATAEFSLQAQERVRSRWSERRKIIQMLLKAKAHVSHVDKYGKTALIYAVKENDLNTVQTLLRTPEMTTGSYFGFGTKPINYADKDGNTALILAIKNARYSYFDTRGYKACLSSQNIIKELLETPGINPHHANKNGETAVELLEKLSN